jgi:ribosomal protein S18 acetylase RimI-like enzyme
MTLSLQPAQESDLSAVVALMNVAFRGAMGQRSWSTEEGYITVTRTSILLLHEEIAEGAHLLVVKDEATSALKGCVSLKASTPTIWYLGSLTVDPALQNSGFGRELLAASELYAAARGARTIQMTVVNVRHALIAWYERRGYQLTGETRPFPYGDTRFGVPTRDDLEFVVLIKHLPG